MKNEYEVRGDVTAIFLKSKKYGTTETLISTKKLDKVKEHPGTWYSYYSKDSGTFYVQSCLPRKNGIQLTVQLHRFVSDAPSEFVVDHKNHDTLNNTDLNLRIATGAENSQNKKGAQKNSKSGIRGVIWRERSKKWEARIDVNRKRTILGYFNDVKDAKYAVIEARSKYMPYSQDALAK